MPDPVQSALDLAHRVVADLEKLIATASGHAGTAGAEGAALAGDAARVVLETAQLAKDKVVELEQALASVVNKK
jgi:hypothetical protein